MKILLTILALSATALMATPSVSVGQSNDIARIKTVIERETTAWNNRDVTAYADCWADVPEAGHLGVLNDEQHTVVSRRNTLSSNKDFLASMGAPSKDTFQNSNYQIRVKGDAAFVQFDQVVTPPDGTKQYGHQTRYLEKIGGKWKIVHVGTIAYEPTK